MSWKNLILLFITVYAIYYVVIIVIEKMKNTKTTENDSQEVFVDIFNDNKEAPQKVSYTPDEDFDEDFNVKKKE